MNAREAEVLRSTFPKFLGGAGADADRVAHAVRCLRAFLVGGGATPAYVDEAAQMFVDTYLDGEAS